MFQGYIYFDYSCISIIQVPLIGNEAELFFTESSMLNIANQMYSDFWEILRKYIVMKKISDEVNKYIVAILLYMVMP